ncbi:phosphatidylglycerophosphatase A family protein [Tepidicaulis sp. LMO-SS28]|uniref:phosphatidylglycerophosphatase A family protein n=1 Tax=Tepidicaulis sp. LMO-SS28 TaxID=3447455 RepID=UPI003EDE8A93
MSAPRRDIAFWVATWFGSGLSPKAPGTAGSLAALIFALPIPLLGLPPLLLLGAALLLFPAGIWAGARYAKMHDTKDPGAVVVDEVVGQWMVLAVAPASPLGWLIALAFFRLFDILKPWPVSWADRKLDGGLGIMMDDVIAALYGMATMVLVTHFLLGGGS